MNPDPDALPLGLQIRNLREARGWSQDVLAAHLRVNRTLITHWESGKRKPNAATLQRVLYLLQPRSNHAPGALAITVTKPELSGILQELERAGKDELDCAIGLVSYSYIRVLSTLILASSGALEIAVDIRAIELYLKHRKELLEEIRQRSLGGARNVTLAQASAVDGSGVYVDPVVVPPVVVDDGTKAP